MENQKNLKLNKMITKEDIIIASTHVDFTTIIGVDLKEKQVFLKRDVRFLLFNIFMCEATIYVDLKTEDEIIDYIIKTFNDKLKKLKTK